MAKKAPAPAAADGAPAKKKKPFPVPISTIIMFVIALPIGWWCFNSYKKWSNFRVAEAKVDSGLAAVRQSPRNASCTASSASASSRRIRYASPYAARPTRSYNSASALSCPRATSAISASSER